MKSFQVYITICLSIGLALSLVGTLSNTSEASSDGEPALREIVVGPGDTVWDLATRYGVPGVDPRRIVHQISELNHLEGYRIHPGQVLLIPFER